MLVIAVELYPHIGFLSCWDDQGIHSSTGSSHVLTMAPTWIIGIPKLWRLSTEYLLFILILIDFEYSLQLPAASHPWSYSINKYQKKKRVKPTAHYIGLWEHMGASTGNQGFSMLTPVFFRFFGRILNQSLEPGPTWPGSGRGTGCTGKRDAGSVPQM